MRHKTRPPMWQIALLFFGGVFIIGAMIMRCGDAGSADWRPGYNFPADLDTMYTTFYRDNVLDDSSAGRTGVNSYDTIFTYTPGEYIRCILWYKYDTANDEWATWTEEYYSASLTGTGPYSVTFLTWDSTTDFAVPRVALTVRPVDQSSHAASPKTDASGYGTANLTADSFVVMEDVPGWTQDNTLDTIVVSGANDTFTVYMDQYAPDAPPGGQVCAVTVIVLDNAGDPAYNVKIGAYLLRSNLRDSAGYAVANYLQEKKTDASGMVTFHCRWSSYLIPATKWRFSVRTPGVGMTKKDITVPRQSTYTLEF